MKVHQVLAVARSHLNYRDISCLPINCDDHPCDNFVFPGDSTEKIYTDQQKVRDEPDIVEDTAEILTPEKSDSDGNKTTEDINQMLRNCRTFGDIQMLFSESCTETLLVDNLPSDRPGSPLEVRLLLETNNAQETTVNNETNEFIAEKYTDNNRKENTDQNDYDEHRKVCTANQMQQLKDRNIFRNANSVFRISYRVFRWT